MRKLWMLVDDVRNGDWDIICRNGETAIRVMNSMEHEIEYLGIDHDLGPGISGYRFMCMLEEAKMIPRKVVIVSDNPVGVKNIGMLLLANGYESIDKRNWTKK